MASENERVVLRWLFLTFLAEGLSKMTLLNVVELVVLVDYLSAFSQMQANAEKMRTRITPNTDSF